MKKRMNMLPICTALILAVSLLFSACGGAADHAPKNGTSAGTQTPAATAAPQPPYAGGLVPPGNVITEQQDVGEVDFAALNDGMSGESYLVIDENNDVATNAESMLTFSLKVDTAAYTNVSRYIGSGNLPPKDAVRTEELLNYFTYDREMSFNGDSPFALYAELGPSPFDADKLLAFVRVKSKDIDKDALPPSNLTFLIDTSGSMSSHDKLPLLQEAFSLLVDTLDEDDTVSIVTYAGNAGVLLDSVPGSDKDAILSAINRLYAGGSTAGAQGISTAYALAEKNYREGGNNRVILATDGDFNVGTSSTDELAKLAAQKRGNGIYLSILGFGTGNIRDDIMETLSREGNGNYAYINSLQTAQKVLVDELASNLFTIADDVKAQVEFNPENVKSYRLIGYENRRLENKDFTDDKKDAGEIGVGTDTIVLFELELHDGAAGVTYKYGKADNATPDFTNELFELRIRYKDPGESASKLLTLPAFFGDITNENSSDFRFASAVAAFSHLLRGSAYTGEATLLGTYALAEGALGRDAGGYRVEFLRLLEAYERIR